MIYDFSAEFFIFLDPVGFIHDAMMGFFERGASEEVMGTIHEVTVVHIGIIWINISRES